MYSSPGFRDRADAGRQLAARLAHLRERRPIVLALPRGGVVVAYEIARSLDAPLDIVGVRKIGAVFQPEFAVGALVDGDHPEIVLDEDSVRLVGMSPAMIRAQVDRELVELNRRERLYREGAPRAEVRDRVVILVDDGVATGASARAALRATRRAGPAYLIMATPVAPPDVLDGLRRECDEVVCLLSPPGFQAVGEVYERFDQTSDEEVIRLLRQARGQETASSEQPPRHRP